MSPPSTELTIVPAPVAAWRRMREALSFSSVRVRAETGTRLVRIGHYSRLAGRVLPGDSVDFVATAGGRKWKLHFYPNGGDKPWRGHRPHQPSVELELMRKSWSGIWKETAAYRVSILGRDGKPAYSCSMAPHSYNVHDWPSDRPVGHLVTAEEKRPAAPLPLMEDDTLVVRCDVTVLRLQRESRIRWFIRQFVKSIRSN
ncbi:hypothetical protein ACP70R_049580 [Stipagrostis hirtigluma subsp. patula]